MMERQACEAFAAVLELDTVPPEANFFDLGGDSLSLLRLFDRLESTWGVTISHSAFLEDPSARGVARLLSGQERVERPAVFPLVERGRLAPLFAVVAGYGDLISLQKLANSMGPGHRVYACQPPDGVGRLAELVSRYVEGILAVDPSGPVHLCGYSIGGLMALEVAAELRSRGREVASLTLLDTWPQLSVSDHVVVRGIRGAFRFALADHPRLQGRVARVVQFVVKDHGFDTHLEALRGHEPAAYDGPVALVVPRLSALRLGFIEHSWRPRFGGRLELHMVSGDHENFIRPPHVKELAGILRRSILARSRLETST